MKIFLFNASHDMIYVNLSIDVPYNVGGIIDDVEVEFEVHFDKTFNGETTISEWYAEWDKNKYSKEQNKAIRDYTIFAGDHTQEMVQSIWDKIQEDEHK